MLYKQVITFQLIIELKLVEISIQMATIATKFPRILIESQRLNTYSTCKMMSGSASGGTPGEGAGKGGGSGGMKKVTEKTKKLV